MKQNWHQQTMYMYIYMSTAQHNACSFEYNGGNLQMLNATRESRNFTSTTRKHGTWAASSDSAQLKGVVFTSADYSPCARNHIRVQARRAQHEWFSERVAMLNRMWLEREAATCLECVTTGPALLLLLQFDSCYFDKDFSFSDKALLQIVNSSTHSETTAQSWKYRFFSRTEKY